MGCSPERESQFRRRTAWATVACGEAGWSDALLHLEPPVSHVSKSLRSDLASIELCRHAVLVLVIDRCFGRSVNCGAFTMISRVARMLRNRVMMFRDALACSLQVSHRNYSADHARQRHREPQQQIHRRAQDYKYQQNKKTGKEQDAFHGEILACA